MFRIDIFCIDIQLPATILNCVTTYAYTIRTPRTLKRLIANSAGVSCTCYVERSDIKAPSAFPDRDIQRHSGPIYGVRPLSIVMGCYKISIESGHNVEQSSQARTVIVLPTSLTKKNSRFRYRDLPFLPLTVNATSCNDTLIKLQALGIKNMF